MNITVLNNSDKPIYEQVYGQIASQIVNGAIEPGSCLPSIRTVARELRISVITVKSAWEMLENEGLIYTRAGKGCFVTEHPPGGLADKKYELARERLGRDLPFYKELGISAAQLKELIDREYPGL